MTYNFVSLCILGLTLLSTFTTVSSKTSLTLLFEHASIYNTKEFKFNDTTYSEFYTCLCDQDTSECLVKYATPDFTVLNTKQSKSMTAHHLFSNYFQCNHNASSEAVNCKRLQRQHIRCNQSNNFTTLPLVNTTTCNKSCLGLAWYYALKESFTYQSVIQPKTPCQSYCYGEPSTGATTSSIKTSTKITSTTSSTPSVTSKGSSKTTTGKQIEKHTTPTTTANGDVATSTKPLTNTDQVNGNHDGDSLPMIIGVVVGILMIVILAIIVFFMWRRRKSKLKGSNRKASTCQILSDEQNDNDIDDYNTIDIEPDYRAASSSASTKTNPVYDLATESSDDGTNNKGPGSTSCNNTQNGAIKEEVVLDDFGYSTVIMDGKKSTEAKKVRSDPENKPEILTDQSSRKAMPATDIDLPEYAVVNKKGRENKNYFNSLPKEDDTSPTPPPLPPNPDLPQCAVVDKTRKIPKDYFNFVTESNEDADPTPPPVSPKPDMSRTQEPRLRPNRSSYDTVDIVGNGEENHPQIRSDQPGEPN